MNNFIINLDDEVAGYNFDGTVADLFEAAGIPVADEYSVNWFEEIGWVISIDSIEADGVVVWQESSIDIDDWTDDDDRLIEGLIGYIEDNVI